MSQAPPQINELAAPSRLKRRKLVDKTLPSGIDEIAEENALYQELLDMERSLDWTMTRKRMEITEAFNKPIRTKRKLRIFLSHTMSGQPWQEPSAADGAPDFETGQGIPAWTFKIEGRLLDVPVPRAGKVSVRKFSSFIKNMIVEFERDPAIYAESNIVEWHRYPNQPPQDGFEIKRKGDASVNARVLLNLEHTPEHYKVSPPLSDIINIKQDTRVGVIAGLWNYIKVNGLQDKVHPTTIKLDQRLAQIFHAAEVPFGSLPELVNGHLMPLDPIVLTHTITVDQPLGPNMQAFDVEVDMDDLALKSKMNQTLLNYSAEAQQTITALDDEIAQAAQAVRNAKLKRDFFRSFEEDPRAFIHTWIASQARDLEVILGDDARGVRAEDLRRADFFKLPWVKEAVQVYEGLRTSGAKPLIR